MQPLSRPCIHAAALMLQNSRRRILSPLSRRRIDAVALTMPYYAAPPDLCSRMHAAAFTPLSRRLIDDVALTPQHWCRRSDAAAFMQHLARRHIFRSQHLAANLMLPHSRRRIYAAARAPPHLRCSSRGPLGAHFPTPSTTPAGGSRRERAQGWAGEGGGGDCF